MPTRLCNILQAFELRTFFFFIVQTILILFRINQSLELNYSHRPVGFFISQEILGGKKKEREKENEEKGKEKTENIFWFLLLVLLRRTI